MVDVDSGIESQLFIQGSRNLMGIRNGCGQEPFPNGDGEMHVVQL